MHGTAAADAPPPPGEPRIEALVDTERVRALFARNTVAQATVLLNSLVVVLVLWESSRPVRLLSWLAAMWLVSAARLVAGVTFRRAERGAGQAARWARIYTLGAALNGVGWGLTPLLLPGGGPLTDLLFLAFVVAGMTAGGALSNASHQPAFLAFTVPALAPVAGAFAAAGGRLQLGMAVMLAVFALAVGTISRSGGRALADATRLRFRNQELAENLATAAAELEHRVRERTSQLEASLTREREAERQLANSIRLASLGTIAAAVAHEVNNPLAYLTSNLTFVRQELGREGRDPELHAAMLTALDDAAAGLTKVKEIVRYLDDASRVKLRAGLEPVDLHSAIEFAVGIADGELRSRATLVREYGEVPPVLAEHTHLVQVFLNLLLNASDALPDGDATAHRIRIATRPEVSTGEVVVEVTDTGSGIPSADLERIWQPFFTTKPRGHASGLGLTICRDLLARIGGRIGVRSREGAGSTFSVWLRAGPSAGPAARGPAAPAGDPG